MFLRIKTIEEFEKTCLKDFDAYIIDESDSFRFPLRTKFWKDLMGKKLEVQEEGYYIKKGVSYRLYRIKKFNCLVPYWFFGKYKKRSLKIE